MTDMKRAGAPTVLLDCDGVVSQFDKAVCPLLTEATGKVHLLEDLTTFSFLEGLTEEQKDVVLRGIYQAEFCANIEPCEGAVAGVRDLGECAEVVWVTSPWHSPTWVSERLAWLSKHFGPLGKNVIVTSPSRLKAKVEGSILVEDQLKTLGAWVEQHPQGIGVLWTQPHNRREQITHPRILRTTDWGLVRRLVEWQLHYGALDAVRLGKDCTEVQFHDAS